MFREVVEPLSINELSAFNSEVTPHVAVAAKAYYDGGGVSGKIVTLAGFAGRPGAWEEFERLWADVLAGDGNRPRCEYLHMTDAKALRKEFSRQRGWDEQKVDALLMDVFNKGIGPLVNNQPEPRFVCASCSVLLDDYERACQHIPRLKQMKEPEAICVDHCLSIALQILPDAPQGEGFLGKLGCVELFFDQNERFLHKINRVWQRRKWRRDQSFMSLIASIVPADMRLVRPLQAADYLNWHVTNHAFRADPVSQTLRWFLAPGAHIDIGYDQIMAKYAARFS